MSVQQKKAAAKRIAELMAQAKFSKAHAKKCHTKHFTAVSLKRAARLTAQAKRIEARMTKAA